MTQLHCIRCPNCKNKQLHRPTLSLIQHIICNTCGYKQELGTILGIK